MKVYTYYADEDINSCVDPALEIFGKNYEKLVLLTDHDSAMAAKDAEIKELIAELEHEKENYKVVEKSLDEAEAAVGALKYSLEASQRESADNASGFCDSSMFKDMYKKIESLERDKAGLEAKLHVLQIAIDEVFNNKHLRDASVLTSDPPQNGGVWALRSAVEKILRGAADERN